MLNLLNNFIMLRVILLSVAILKVVKQSVVLLSAAILKVVKQSVVLLSVGKLSVVMLSVVAPSPKLLSLKKYKLWLHCTQHKSGLP